MGPFATFFNLFLFKQLLKACFPFPKLFCCFLFLSLKRQFAFKYTDKAHMTPSDDINTQHIKKDH